MLRSAWLSIFLLGLLTGCTGEKATPSFFPESNPSLLSDWGQFDLAGGVLEPASGVVAYDLNAPLFSDYAAKLRTIWSVDGTARETPQGALDFPIGTVITKTFYYGDNGEKVHAVSGDRVSSLSRQDHRFIETRLLVRREDGWHPISYVWNEDQTEATLKRTGAVVPLTLVNGNEEESFAYIVPNENQCAACHASDTRTNAVHPLGPTLAQLDREDQLASWKNLGLLAEHDEPKAPQVAWNDEDAGLDARARSYLAANCAHCHNPYGPADTSGLDLTLSAEGAALGRCKPPIAAGSGTGGHRFGIEPGHSQSSILRYRMASTAPGSMMPELGRSLVHSEGVSLIDAWIDDMEGRCS